MELTVGRTSALSICGLALLAACGVACAKGSVRHGIGPVDGGPQSGIDSSMPAHQMTDGEAVTSSCSPPDCDDKNPCTTDDCLDGACIHTPNSESCADDEDSCTDDTCAGGLCTHPSNGSCKCQKPTDCDDQNPCTDDACSNNACVYTPKEGSCPSDDDECRDGVCVSGICQHVNSAEKPCADDKNTCTSDVCSGGYCTHPANGNCECANADDCNDNNPCTTDSCGGDGHCKHDEVTGACPDDGNPCTDDQCASGACTHANNKVACASDSFSCTDDVCENGACTHQDNMTCECIAAADCNDANPCTDDSCSPAGKCVHSNNTAPCNADSDQCTCDVCAAGVCTHPSKDTCVAASAFDIDNFNSSSDWNANQTTPGHLAITGRDSFDASNLEGDSDLYLAESNTASLEFAAPELSGLKNIALEMQSDQTGMAAMIKLGVFNAATSAWVEKTLSSYGSVTQGAYGTITVPLADFAVQTCNISKVRLAFNVTGGQKIFRIQGISAK
jgi:hypothetical protein